LSTSLAVATPALGAGGKVTSSQGKVVEGAARGGGDAGPVPPEVAGRPEADTAIAAIANTVAHRLAGRVVIGCVIGCVIGVAWGYSSGRSRT
jgi:hypothetical protein